MRPLAVLVSLVLFGTRVEADQVMPNPAPDPAAILAAGCRGCHGLSAAEAAIPSLSGWSKTALIDQMMAYREASDGSVMARLARGYSPDEIAAIAQYLARSHR